MSYDYYDTEARLSISAVGEALIALEKEVEKLDHDASLLHSRLKLVTTKQRICTAAIKKLLEAANGGVFPELKQWPEFPELSHKDEA